MNSTLDKPTSPATERNREPILKVLRQYLVNNGRLLEIGSGTGQHAVYFANHFKKLQWVTSDLKSNHSAISAWIEDTDLQNVLGPEVFQVGKDDFPKGSFDYVFSANTLHIMSWSEDKILFELLGKNLSTGSLVFFYGPFNYDGQFTSSSNRDFDYWLKSRNEKSGIRDFEDVYELMSQSGFDLVKDHEMPANNRLLVFKLVTPA